jgi:hypothetical protein
MRDFDRFGASDAWLMFALWMWTAGHPLIAAFSGTICLVICAWPDPKPKASSEGEQ